MKIHRLVFATDFSECSQDALTHARYLATELRAEVGLVHVFERPFFIETGVSHRLQLRHDVDQWIHEAKDEAKQQLDSLANELRTQGLTVTVSMREGIPFVEILKAADELRADLVVVGTHGRTGLSHALIGSVAERVIERAPCAVLAVRPKSFSSGKPASA
jgi:nucleotide-binding universal stress UspA family protein